MTDVSKDTRFSVRLDEQDRARLEALAEHYAVSPSGVVRMLVKQAHDQTVKTRGGKDGG